MKRLALGNRKLRWWQLRTEDFALLLYIIIVPRVLVLGLYVTIAASADISGTPIYISDFVGWNLSEYFDLLMILAYLLVLICSITAVLERPYGRIKWVVLFSGMATLLFLVDRTTEQTLMSYL
ncbi:MAG: hypothetical protein AAF317_20680 [Pseudomonadota bacterium]